MARFFNTAGPCDPDDHYMLPPEDRIPDVPRLIERHQYFTVHAARQTGKTTTFRALAERLTREGAHAAVHTTCEVGQSLTDRLSESIDAVISVLRRSAELQLPTELRPPPADADQPPSSRLYDVLSRWSAECSRPVVLFLDEIDALYDDVLLTVLRQLRAGYGDRPESFPASIALVGLRDVRDYRIETRSGRDSLGTSSPFNVKVDSLTMRDFTAEEVATLYAQHTEETGQVWRPEAVERAFELTRGQPWLVNALAREVVDQLAEDRSVPLDPGLVETAKEILIQRRDTHLDSLAERLREPRVQRILEPILAGRLLDTDTRPDDLEFVRDLGLVRPDRLEIANPIYREVVPRALSSVAQESLPIDRRSFLGEDGSLLFVVLLDEFSAFWRQNADEYLSRQPYSEAAAQLVFMAWLQRVVNGGGFVDREYGVGRGRIDLCVRWPRSTAGVVDRFAVELKVWRDGRPDPEPEGLEQLTAYLEKLNLDRGTLLIFDTRSQRQGTVVEPQAHRVGEREIEVRRL